MAEKLSRKEQILQCLAKMLEEDPGRRITTSALAKEVGVSEAALYRHFPSKARMFEGLIEFIDQSLFHVMKQITTQEGSAAQKCEQMLWVWLLFAERNPGLARIMSGDALTGETERLRVQVDQLFNKLEAQFKQLLRKAEAEEGLNRPVTAIAALLLAYLEGNIRRYVRTEFRDKPTTHWERQWPELAGLLITTH